MYSFWARIALLWSFSVHGGALSSAFATPAGEPVLRDDRDKRLDSQVKAEYLFKFGNFIDWPAPVLTDTNAPFVIGILGKDPFGRSFAEAGQSERVKDRPVEMRWSSTAEKLTDCQIVFIARSEAHRLDELLSTFAGKPILVVTDEPGAVQRGSMINFFKDRGKVRFELNLAAADRAHLKFSAKLLQVGKVVVARSPEGSRNP
jgi:hypothetical protein